MSRRNTGACILVLILAGWTGNEAAAVSPRIWKTAGVEDWTAADRESVGVGSDGTVRLARGTGLIEGLNAFVIWDLIEDGSDLLLATGDDGSLYRVSPSGDVEQEGQVLQPEITALGRDGKGRVLAGAAPDGVLYRLEDDKLQQVADTPESYIWRILPDDDGGTLVATGNSGKIYRLTGQDELEIFVDLGTVHVNGLEREGDGFIATTESPGRVLRIDAKGSVTVLFDADEPEVRSPVVREDGTVFFLANSEAGIGSVYRLLSPGSAEVIWTAVDGFVYSMKATPEGTLWVTTGLEQGSGSLLELEPGPTTIWTELIRVDEPQILALLLSEQDDRRWMATGGMGRLYRVLGEDAIRGTVVSEVEDAGTRARWGALAVEPGPLPRGVTLESRSGDTRKPDDTWSKWEVVVVDGDRGAVPSPPARFLQWRAVFERSESRVEAIQVVYLPANLSPQMTSLEISALGSPFQRIADRGQPASLSQELPGGVRVEFQTGNRTNGDQAEDGEAAWARRYRTVTWEALDPNQDQLRYDVFLRARGERDWKPIAEDLESSPWIWDSATVPDGWYGIKVTVSDRVDNPPGEERTAFRISQSFLVDNTPPVVVRMAVSGDRVVGVAEDASSAIKRLELAVDGTSWTQLFPEDGIPDMPREAFSIPIAGLLPGEHVLVIRVFDLAGNPGTGRVSFTAP
jgi:hypothetical protein